MFCVRAAYDYRAVPAHRPPRAEGLIVPRTISAITEAAAAGLGAVYRKAPTRRILWVESEAALQDHPAQCV